ncbi:MAG: hypothetical protein DRG78_06555 [Epsilonproteobacteria bacterium]|nr:MAG: hypothetical protein DRG78_06555 [Campylobacterota bacterium]
MWLTSLKVAIVERNTDRLNELMDDIPQLEKEEDIEQAIYLLKEATELVQKLQNETSVSMKQMKKNIDFLKSTQHRTSNRLDITS